MTSVRKIGKTLGIAFLIAGSATATAVIGRDVVPLQLIESDSAMTAANLKNGYALHGSCRVYGRPLDGASRDQIIYDFGYSAVSRHAPLNAVTTRVSIRPFHSISEPALQAQVRAAHTLLPSYARCAAPDFTPDRR